MKYEVVEMLRADGECTEEHVKRFKKYFEAYEVEDGDLETLELALEDAGVPKDERVGILYSLKNNQICITYLGKL